MSSRPTAPIARSGGFAAGVVLAGLLLSSPNAEAFECLHSPKSGVSMFWRTRSIPWYASSTLSDDMPHEVALEEIQAAFATWEDVDCSDLELPFRGSVPDRVSTFDAFEGNKNIVVFIESGWKDEPTTIAWTRHFYDIPSGLIVDADIELNGQHHIFAKADRTCVGNNTRDLRATVTHEVGHLLGLDHPPDRPEFRGAAMFATQAPCTTGARTLGEDDVDGLCFLYPADAPTGRCPNKPVEDDSGCTTSGGRDPWALGLCGVLFALRRRCGGSPPGKGRAARS